MLCTSPDPPVSVYNTLQGKLMKYLLTSMLIISSVLLPLTELLICVRKYSAGTDHALYGGLAFVVFRAMLSGPILRYLSGTLPYYMFSVSRPALCAVFDAVLSAVFSVMGLYTAFLLSGRDRINGYSAIVLSSAYAAMQTIYVFGIPAVYGLFSNQTYLNSFNDISRACLSSVLLFTAAVSSGILVSETALNRKSFYAFASLLTEMSLFIALNSFTGGTSAAALLPTAAFCSFFAFTVTRKRIIGK